MTMELTRKSFQKLTSAVLTILALTLIAQAQTPALSATIKIKNFGQMDERFYRGAQPKNLEDYQALAALGVKTVIDLTDDPKEYEQSMVESVGMKYVHIPMIAKKYPTEAAIANFLKTVENPETGKFYLHCAGGRHRTGAMGAVYRYKFYNWNFEQVYKEMKQYDFYTSWGHGAFKDFVKDYYEQMQTATTSTAAPSTVESNAGRAQEKQ
jgi:tyrosine-protein phosphatase SIW14